MLILIFLSLLLGAGLVRWHPRAATLFALPAIAALTTSVSPVTQKLLDRTHSLPTMAPEETGRNTLIVLLGAGIQGNGHQARPGLGGYSRLLTAAQRFHRCRQLDGTCRVLVSGGAPSPGLDSEANVYARELIDLDIPAAAILLEDASANTWQNARNSSALIAKEHASHVLLVTSGLHLPRSLLYFRHFGVTAEGVASDQIRAMPGWLPSTFNLLLVEVMLHERIGVLRYHAYNRLGWNEPPMPPTHLNPQTTTHASPH